MPTAVHHLVFGHELAKEVADFLAANDLGVVVSNIKLDRLSDKPLAQICVRGENGPMLDSLSHPRLRIWVRDLHVKLCIPKVQRIYGLLHQRELSLATIAAYLEVDATDESVRNELNFVTYPIGFRSTCHPKAGVAPTDV